MALRMCFLSAHSILIVHLQDSDCAGSVEGKGPNMSEVYWLGPARRQCDLNEEEEPAATSASTA